jgi:hypothetical protein
MRVLQEKYGVRYYPIHPFGPEAVLQIPSLLIINRTYPDKKAFFLHPISQKPLKSDPQSMAG